MEYFSEFTSNTLAGSGNQLTFTMEPGEMRCGRIFYKIFSGGEYDYSVLFSNIIDSTYADGSLCHKNKICPPWTIHSALIGRCTEADFGEFSEGKPLASGCKMDFVPMYFNGNQSRIVNPGEFFSCDPVRLKFNKGDYLCIEICFSGSQLPYHEESLLPVYVKKGEGWEYSRKMPFASMIGCNRKVKKKVAVWGDSITQGIGAPMNSYLHWNSLLADMLGDGNAYWNLGIGYGKAYDASSGGAWMYKAEKNDVAIVCFGVNDIFAGRCADEIKSDLKSIVTQLKDSGAEVILQTIPPFNYTEEKITVWNDVNEYIKTELKPLVHAVFDCVPFLGADAENMHVAKYGGHPNEEGCRIWAEELYTFLKHTLSSI